MAAVSGGESSGIALLNPVNGTVDRMVESYSAGSQALGAYDGRYAVWEESHTAGSFDDYVVKEWDAATGSTTVVGGSHTDAHGAPIEGSEELPVIAGHYAAWLEAIKDDGESDLVVLDLRSGKRTVIRRAHANWVALTARTIVWSESLRPNAKTVIRAADLATGKATDPPAALAGVRGAWAFVTDGTAWVWIQGDRPTLYAATSSSAAPVKIGMGLRAQGELPGREQRAPPRPRAGPGEEPRRRNLRRHTRSGPHRRPCVPTLTSSRFLRGSTSAREVTGADTIDVHPLGQIADALLNADPVEVVCWRQPG